MHQVVEQAMLGSTIDEYHARLQIRYLTLLPAIANGALDVACQKYGKSPSEVLIEVKLPDRNGDLKRLSLLSACMRRFPSRACYE